MKIPSLFSAAILAAITTLGSDAFTIEEENTGATKMVLGDKLDNPYTVDNMQDAAMLAGGSPTLAADPSFLGGKANSLFLDSGVGPVGPAGPAGPAAAITTTHKYVKITPRTEDDLIFLQALDDNDDDDIVLHDHPLDKEVLQEGDYYVEADVNVATDYSPVYTVLPVNYNLPSWLQVEEVDRLHEPADDGSEEGIELTAMESSGLDPDSPYPVKAPIHMRGRRKLLFGRRYRPRGCVYVWDTSINDWSPLRQAKISIGRLVWWRYTHTDDNGCWSSPKKYRGRVYIRAKWRSNIATIRKSWNEMLGFFVSDRLFTMTRGSNPKNKHIPSSDDRLWMKGTVHNGLVLYNDYALSEGIDRPIGGANVWVWANGDSTASAPMLKRLPNLPQMASIAGLTQGNFWSAIIGIFSLVLTLVPSHLRPDFIFSGISQYRDTRRIHQVVFHEAAHWSHAVKAGSFYWANVFVAEISNYVATGGPYGDGTEPSQDTANQIALAEGWATLTESYIMDAHYDGMYEGSYFGNWQPNARVYLDRFDMNSVPMTRDRSTIDHWFLHGLFSDCVDANEGGSGLYRDGVTGVTINAIDDNVNVQDSRELYPIFRYMTGDVKDACDFGNKFVQGYAYDFQDIIDLFLSYGFDCVNYVPPPPTRQPTRLPTTPGGCYGDGPDRFCP